MLTKMWQRDTDKFFHAKIERGELSKKRILKKENLDHEYKLNRMKWDTEIHIWNKNQIVIVILNLYLK